MDKTSFFRYIEKNDDEGETWSVFIKMPETESEQLAFDALSLIVESASKNLSNNQFTIQKSEDGDLIEYDADFVERIMNENEFSLCSYMNAYNYGIIPENLIPFAEQVKNDPSFAEEMLYKVSAFQFTEK